MNAFNERRQMRGQGGFTLIELLVVIAILGILAGVVVFAVGGVTGTADKKACEIEGKSIETAAQAFRADSVTGNSYPTAWADLAPTYMKDGTKLAARWNVPTNGETTGLAGSKCENIVPN